MARRAPSAAALGCLLAASILTPAQAGPLALAEAELDQVTAGAASAPGYAGFPGGVPFTTQISMPVSTAIAICFMCSGDASATAIASAVSMAQADAFAVATGQAQGFALSSAVGPYLVLLPPPAPPSRARRAGSR